MRRLLVLALLTSSATLGAQGTAHTVSPGMTRAKVVAALGEPATVRSAAEFTYMFYKNACAKRCGMNDLVVLRADTVVDAIFRSPTRHYTGTSSSPAPISQKDAAQAKPTSAGTVRTPAPRMVPPSSANDARPSIPAQRPALTPAPAPSTSPAPRAP